MAHEQLDPCEVTSGDGWVIVDGPHYAVTMTPEVATETADRLYAAAVMAKGQQVYARDAAQGRQPASTA